MPWWSLMKHLSCHGLFNARSSETSEGQNVYSAMRATGLLTSYTMKWQVDRDLCPFRLCQATWLCPPAQTIRKTLPLSLSLQDDAKRTVS